MTSLTTAAGMTAGEKSTSRPPSSSGRMADGRRRSWVAIVTMENQLRLRPSAIRPPVGDAEVAFSPAVMPAAVVSEVIALPLPS